LSAGSRLAPCCTRATRSGREDSVTSPTYDLFMAAATSERVGFAAVVLSGGTGARLGGTDKAALEVGGRTLLERALAAVAGADEVVVVGRPMDIGDPVAAADAHDSRTPPVRFVVEDPPSGGPAAGLLAGLAALAPDARLVVVLAVDMPYVGPTTVSRLLDALGGEEGSQADGAFLVDEGGRRQLAGVLRPERLDPPEDRHGLPLHRLLAGLTLTQVPVVGREALDVDTWADVRDLRAHGPA
jgi:molybdopterin-guanine dinucleotide biosynthesis protein A